MSDNGRDVPLSRMFLYIWVGEDLWKHMGQVLGYSFRQCIGFCAWYCCWSSSNPGARWMSDQKWFPACSQRFLFFSPHPPISLSFIIITYWKVHSLPHYCMFSLLMKTIILPADGKPNILWIQLWRLWFKFWGLTQILFPHGTVMNVTPRTGWHVCQIPVIYQT